MPKYVDHINQKKDDNRWENLRAVEHQENMMNSKKRSDNTSGFTGVHWYKSKQKWQSSIWVDGKSIHLGFFKKLSDAVFARVKAENIYGFHPNHGTLS